MEGLERTFDKVGILAVLPRHKNTPLRHGIYGEVHVGQLVVRFNKHDLHRKQ